MKRWLASYAEDIGLLALVLVVLLVIIGLLAWGGATLWERHQSQQAAQERAENEQAIRTLHKAWCNHPPGGLADGSCE